KGRRGIRGARVGRHEGQTVCRIARFWSRWFRTYIHAWHRLLHIRRGPSGADRRKDGTWLPVGGYGRGQAGGGRASCRRASLRDRERGPENAHCNTLVSQIGTKRPFPSA